MAITPEHALNIGRKIAREMCGRSWVAEDVAQAAAIGAIFAPEGCEWRAARFRAIDELRRRTGYVKYWGSVRGDIPTDDDVLVGIGGSASDEYDEGSIIDGVGLDPRLSAIARGLMDGREKREIAAELGITPSRVSQLIHEVRDAVASVLRDDPPEGAVIP